MPSCIDYALVGRNVDLARPLGDVVFRSSVSEGEGDLVCHISPLGPGYMQYWEEDDGFSRRGVGRLREIESVCRVAVLETASGTINQR